MLEKCQYNYKTINKLFLQILEFICFPTISAITVGP